MVLLMARAAQKYRWAVDPQSLKDRPRSYNCRELLGLVGNSLHEVGKTEVSKHAIQSLSTISNAINEVNTLVMPRNLADYDKVTLSEEWLEQVLSLVEFEYF